MSDHYLNQVVTLLIRASCQKVTCSAKTEMSDQSAVQKHESNVGKVTLVLVNRLTVTKNKNSSFLSSQDENDNGKNNHLPSDGNENKNIF